MLFGQSVFQSVLTRLEEEHKDEENAGTADAAYRVRGLGTAFVAPTDMQPASADVATDAYSAYLPDAGDDTKPEEEGPAEPESGVEDTPEAPVIPPHLLRLTEAEIAEDLAIGTGDTEAALTEKRRQFAKANHPDRVEPQWRDNATTRMQIANLLIDRAIRTSFLR